MPLDRLHRVLGAGGRVTARGRKAWAHARLVEAQHGQRDRFH